MVSEDRLALRETALSARASATVGALERCAMTDLDVIDVATIWVFPTKCDVLCVRGMSTWFQQIAEVHTIPSEQRIRPQIFD